jgi:hypothetical protein
MRLLALKKKMTTKGDLLGHCQQVLLRKLVNLFWCCSRVEEASFLSFLKHNDEKKKKKWLSLPRVFHCCPLVFHSNTQLMLLE